MPKPVLGFFVLETLSEVRDKKSSASIFNSKCRHATATGVALYLRHGTAVQIAAG